MLDKRSKNILILFGVALLVVIISEVIRPKPINWWTSYTAQDTIPFGSKVFFDELPALFKNATIKTINEDPYEFLVKEKYESNSAYLLINEHILLDEQRFESLRTYVEKGNTAFVSAHYFGYMVTDSLNLDIFTSYSFAEDDIFPHFYSKNLKTEKPPKFKRGVTYSRFESIDTLKTQALGYIETEGVIESMDEHDYSINEEEQLDENINYIRVPYGDGYFYFHTLPEAFSNYYMLNGADEYTANVMAFIDADTVYWDAFIKDGKKTISSKMRFIFDQAPLKWAYYVTIVGLLIFVIFKGKREQRIIEVIEPLENTSIEFTRTIGNLYYQHKDFGNIIAKKISYFMENIRTQYYLDTNDLSETFIKKLALKSGNSIEETRKAIKTIQVLKGKSFHTEQDLITLNKLIENFKTP
ncbi:hypothetical protein ULMS_13960 [Patiriisocius marinistellae]|uniref:DUF4350 domain-containing protein n=1 Tax=Patiriisocius marinistellae TaxID=2494560 RepID=A0A5J4FX41_9FLAO|nr:DUF4350 domain-containing protein [Patiriisocius marinistellae]GEQ85888.1 hypothetical protein ULMS_13960 [Patiriisocius marinistellae]